MPSTPVVCTAFEGTRRIASGTLEEVALAAKEIVDRGERAPVLVFDDTTGQVVDLNLQGTTEEVRAWALAQTRPRTEPGATGCAVSGAGPRGPGRPKLGVVSKEVTLLPRHWAWLGAQHGSASATLRRLVDEARRAGERKDRVRQAQDAAFRFMSAMAGDLPGFEEAIRALFRGNPDEFEAETRNWPGDVYVHTTFLAAEAFRKPSPAG